MTETPDFKNTGDHDPGKGPEADPRLDFESAADAPELTTNGDQVKVHGYNAALNGIGGQHANEEDETYLKRIEAHIHELYQKEQEEQKREQEIHAKINEAYENNNLITLAHGTYRYGILPGGNFKYNDKKGELSSAEDLSQPPRGEAQKRSQNKKIAAMIQQAANGNMRHAIVMTRKPLFSFKRRDINPITGKPQGLPTFKSSLFGGAMEPNPNLAQSFNQIVPQLKKEGKISQDIDITFHSSEKELRHALEQEKEALKNELGNPEEAQRNTEKYRQEREDLEALLKRDDSQSGFHAGEGSQTPDQEKQKHNTMQLRRAQQPAHQPS